MSKLLHEIRKTLNVGKFNKIEKIYVIFFICSIILGTINGIINTSYFVPYQQAGQLDIKEGENNFTIFYRNFLLSAIDLITAGISSFYFNFTSFSTASSFLYSQGILYGLIFMVLIYGIYELLGAMLIGLIGFSFVERIFKVKSKLNVKKLFILGGILLFVSSVIEYSLVVFLR